MEWLNYHHLLYFWVVAREGSIAAACKRLRLAQPTISGQLRALEARLGQKLFERRGRGLVLTETGRVVFRYADEIFSLGQELADVVAGRPSGRPTRLVVGIADAVPKLVAYHLLRPAFALPTPPRVICREARPDRLLAELAQHELDLVLSDAPIPAGSAVRAYNHLLGECGVSFLAAAPLARSLARGFPRSLDGAPMILPAEGLTLRRSLEAWFDDQALRPTVVAETDDSALSKVLGQAALGVFVTPRVIEAEVARQFDVRCIGRTDAVTERFYALSAERRLRHPAVVAITRGARSELFG